MEFQIWEARPGDEDAIVALEAASLGLRSWGAKSLREGLIAGRAATVLAGLEGQPPWGFAMWRRLEEDAELLTIGVAPDARRQGVGAKLIAAVMAASRRVGATRMLLEVDANNEAALALYRSAGFAALSVRKGYYRDGADALVMAAPL